MGFDIKKGYKKFLIIATGFFYAISCNNINDKAGKFLPYLNVGVNPKVLVFSPGSNEANVAPNTKIQTTFDRLMKIDTCVSSFVINPNVTGFYQTTPISIEFTPSANLSTGTYTVTITKGCESEEGHDLKDVFTSRFAVGAAPGSTLNLPSVLSMNTNRGNLPTCLAGTGTTVDFSTNDTIDGCLGITTNRNPISVSFSEPMNTDLTSLAVTLSPNLPSNYDWSLDGKILTITPDSPYPFGQRITVNVSSNAVNTSGTKIVNAKSASFVAGGIFSSPVVQAVGLASQGCANSLPGVGSVVGGDWTLGSCFWDSSLGLLSAGLYRFRGGDDGTGLAGSTNACGDVNTDNFRLIFSNYMQTAITANAVRIQRVSPPLTNARISSYNWSDCQATFPFGCRSLTVSFAEQEASCNGVLFGDATTGGDFNMLRTNTSPAGFPIYNLIVDTSAKDVNGYSLQSQFIFGVEGK
ncbi:hypothetical protein DLM76_18200 [Leptospira yasudae]|uniref:Ig-like domain-containing protein n=1 Tax=Leptospira yasudae TaxID=2202201 RepID=UPI000E59EAC9|nr:Ig-like domain-containing protein [Leptospira yasudae]RHX91639.1 hypothetical protein DLM76_18200 [Leptospira yasudae]